MHKVTLTIDGVVKDSAAAELEDVEAFLRYTAAKRALLEGAPEKHSARKTKSTSPDAPEPSTPTKVEEA